MQPRNFSTFRYFVNFFCDSSKMSTIDIYKEKLFQSSLTACEERDLVIRINILVCFKIEDKLTKKLVNDGTKRTSCKSTMKFLDNIIKLMIKIKKISH